MYSSPQCVENANNNAISLKYWQVWFLCYMAYQPLWVIYCHLCWRTAMILFNFKLGDKSISPKVNIIELEFKLIWFQAAVQHFCHYIIRTPPTIVDKTQVFCHEHITQICIYQTPSPQGQFLSGVKLVWILSFPSLRWVALSRLEYRFISKNISMKWNENSLFQDLNSGCWFYFQRL